MGGQIAQIQQRTDHPASDSGLFWLFDFLRGKFYWCSNKAILRYTTIFETKTPEVWSYAWTGTILSADVDLVSGDLLLHRGPNGSGGISNGTPVYKFDHNTLAMTGQFGNVVSGFPGPWPSSFWGNASLCCFASGGVGYCVIMEGVVANPHYGVINVSTMTAVGTFFQLLPGATGPAAMLAGPSCVFFQISDVAGTGMQFLKLIISGGVPAFVTLGHLTPAMIDGTCTAVGRVDSTGLGRSWGLDTIDNNIFLTIVTSYPDGSGGTVKTNSFAKIDPNTGAVLWMTPITYPLTAFYGYPAYPPNSITGGIIGQFGPQAYGQLNTVDGTFPLLSGWLRTFYSSTYVPFPGATTVFGYTVYTNNPGLGTSQPVAGTPTSFDGWAIEQPTVTEAPVAFGCDQGTMTSLTTHWNDMYQLGVPSYTIEYRVAGSTSPWTVVNAGRRIDYTITGLAPGTTYEWQVRAEDPLGYVTTDGNHFFGIPSLWSNVVTCTTLPPPPPQWEITSKFSAPGEGGIGDLWMDQRYVDFSDVATRRKFISADKMWVDVGYYGEIPFGTSPRVWNTVHTGNTPRDFTYGYGQQGAANRWDLFFSGNDPTTGQFYPYPYMAFDECIAPPSIQPVMMLL